MNIIYLIDYGLAKYYRDPISKVHIPFRDNHGMTGTLRYASINSHLGEDQSRRDDLESLMYSLIYLLKGMLPWQGIKASVNTRNEKIAEKKIATSNEVLCEDVPSTHHLGQFCLLLEMIKRLKFDETPNYSLMRKIINKLFVEKEFFKNAKFDWQGVF